MKNNSIIILIISHKEKLDEYEKISIKQCFNILGKYPIRFICPEGLDVSDYNSFLFKPQFDFIDPYWQSTYYLFNRLKIEPFLYDRYKEYDYILFYEPDAFVFSDELEKWCNKEYDYIAAPWFEGYDKPVSDKLIGVGNGGFCLRKTESHLMIWENKFKFKRAKTVKNLISDFKNRIYNKDLSVKVRSFIYLLRQIMFMKDNSVRYYLEKYNKSEDGFWSYIVPQYFKNYRVADFKNAIDFSFEVKPRLLYSINGNKLPFGCHAWWKYDLDFWRPFIEKYGYNLQKTIDYNKYFIRKKTNKKLIKLTV